MNITEIITAVDRARPNSFDNDQKTRWLSEVEGMIVDDILNMAEGNDYVFSGYVYSNDYDKELYAPERFSDVYEHYLRAKIEYSEDEIAQYNNAMMAFQSAFDYFAAYYRRNHMPKTRGKFIV